MKNIINGILGRTSTAFCIAYVSIFSGCDTKNGDDVEPDLIEQVDPNEYIPLHRIDILDNGTVGKQFEVKFHPMDSDKHKTRTYLSSENGTQKIIFKNRDLQNFGELIEGTYTNEYDLGENDAGVDSILLMNAEGKLIAGYVGKKGNKNGMINSINFTKTPNAIEKAMGMDYVLLQ